MKNNVLVEQYEWLIQDLAKANENRDIRPWIVVYGHRPMYCSNVDDIPDCSTDAEVLRRGLGGSRYSMEDLLMKFSVDLYFTAHEHSYERTFPVYKGQIDRQSNHSYVNPKYPVHIVTGAGGCVEDLDL